MKYVKFISLLLIILLLSSCEEEMVFNGGIIKEPNNQIVIEIKGAVNFPGVYYIEEGTILKDVINLAGGYKPNANTININQVMVLSNNQMIYIPYIENKDTNETKTLININDASLEELMNIPGVGSVKANNIINYRNEIGSFISIEQLKEVPGISESIYEKIKTMVTLQ